MHYSVSWLDHFKRHADAARDKVKEETKVGAVLVGSNNEVLLTAYNGPAIGVIDTPQRRSREGGLKYKYSAHAERNLISFAARRGMPTEGLTIYSTHFPCSACAGAIIQAGIKCVIVGYGEFKSSDGDIEHSKIAFHEANVKVIHHQQISALLDKADNLARAILPSSEYYLNKRAVLNAPNEFTPQQLGALVLYKRINSNTEDFNFISNYIDPEIGKYLHLISQTISEIYAQATDSTSKSVIEIILAHLYEEINPEYHCSGSGINQAEIDSIQRFRFKLIDHYVSEYAQDHLFYQRPHAIFRKDSYSWGNP